MLESYLNLYTLLRGLHTRFSIPSYAHHDAMFGNQVSKFAEYVCVCVHVFRMDVKIRVFFQEMHVRHLEDANKRTHTHMQTQTHQDDPNVVFVVKT